MKKRSTKILSLVLAMIMVFSLVPVSAYAAPKARSETGVVAQTDGPSSFFGDLGRLIKSWGKILSPKPFMPAITLVSDEFDGVTVTVKAPTGALPEGTTMEVKPVSNMDAVQAAVDETPDVSGTALIAADITFFDADGNEIQPAKAITVAFSSDELAGREDLTVVHLDLGADELGENEVPAEPVESTVGTNAVIFQARHFSVYVIVDDGSTTNEARVEVNFWNGSTKVASVWVKNSDELLGSGDRDPNKSYIEDIVYDPGVGGTLPSGKLFMGWSPDVTGLSNKPEGTYVGNSYNNNTTPLTIAGIRSLLDSFTITEGDVLNVYAMVFNVFNITYEDANGVTLASMDALCSINDTSVSYTINQSYNAVDDSHHFDGWHVKEGADHISDATYQNQPATDPYQQNTTMTVSGNIVFSSVVSPGHWLVFVENGKGATYNAPVFVKSGQTAASVRPTPSLPANMNRLGYDFVNWYELNEGVTIDQVAKDSAGYYIITDEQFHVYNFNQELEDRVTIYAKWTVASSAEYTVVVWKQKTNGSTDKNNYDFSEAKTLSGTPLTTVNTVHQTGATVTDADGSYQNIVVDGWKEIGGDDYLGFHAADYDTNVEIKPNGTTVVNIYYNRNKVQLNFNIYGYTYTKISSINDIPRYSDYGTFYVPNSSGGYDAYYLTRSNGTVYYYLNGYGWTQYNGDTSEIYTRSDGGWSNYKTLTGLYGAKLTGWPSEYDWYASYSGSSVDTSSTRTTFLDAFIPASTSMIVNYYGTTNAGGSQVHFMQQNASGTGYTETNTVYVGNNGYTWLLSDKYTGFQCVAWNTTNNTSNWNRVGNLMQVVYRNNQWVEVTTGGDLYYDAYPNTSGFQPISRDNGGDLYIYYDRLSYKIKYSDGTYKDYKDENKVDEDPQTQGFGTSADITYGASIAAYGDPNSSVYNKPTQEGYYFAGWFADSTCNIPYNFDTMPLGGVQVYAKWIQVGYRVFLHPDAERDATLDWGSETQKMSFSVGYGGTVSVPTGRRTGYEFLGWFYASGAGFDSETKLNDTTVPATPVYDKTVDMTDDIDKWGYVTNPSNSDVNRVWITRKLDLYAKWSKYMIGASGIEVIYDANGGSQAPNDTRIYKENVDAVAQAASKAPTNVDPEQQFLYWVIQKWDATANNGEGAFVDLEGDQYHKYPGQTFTVKDEYARAEPQFNEDGTPQLNAKGEQVTRYTIQLRAEYGVKDAPTPTHITWYANGGVYDPKITGEKIVNGDVTLTYVNLQINEAVDIPGAANFSRYGSTFLGWAKYTEPEDAFDPDNNTVDESKYSPVENLTLWLKAKSNGKYDELNADGTVKNADVEQVAADEALPYNALYAVWETNCFYVYHSSTGMLEAVDMNECDAEGKFDLTSKVNNSIVAPHLYGGYYKSCGGVTETNVDNAKPLSLAASNHQAAVTDAVLYTGESLKVDTSTRFWVKANAYKTANNDLPGNAMKPAEGAVYYLKEVPACYLQTHARWSYKVSNGEIQQMFFLTCVDDTYYTNIGFTIITDNKVASVVTNFSYQVNGQSNIRTIKANELIGQRGYLGVVDATSYISYIFAATEESPVKVIPYWTTLDGVKVETNGYGFYKDGEGDALSTGNLRYKALNAPTNP